MVEIGGFPDLVVGFVDCVEEVGGYYYYVDAPSVEEVFWGTGLGFGVAGADHEAVIERLYPACNELTVVSKCCEVEEWYIHWGGMTIR